ncbi:MAG: hypothetical protein IPI10_06355 [Bacteroidetes bacterium]|nr:hypothetical protein [Bacteroidota bacterium]
MIKIVLLFVSAISLFIASIFVSNESMIYVEQSFPTEVKPGSEFTVTLTVHKGSQSGFARLQQFLPKGFKAEALETKKHNSSTMKRVLNSFGSLCRLMRFLPFPTK